MWESRWDSDEYYVRFTSGLARVDIYIRRASALRVIYRFIRETHYVILHIEISSDNLRKQLYNIAVCLLPHEVLACEIYIFRWSSGSKSRYAYFDVLMRKFREN
jgi:hypothetical protein